MNALTRLPRRACLLSLLLIVLLFGSALPTYAQSRPLTAGQITEYSLPQGHNPFGSIAKGPDGDLWFLEYPANMVGKMTIHGTFTEYRIPTPTSRPVGIAAGPDGNMWFTEWWGNNIGKITPSGHITEYPLPTPNAYPADITLGPDGNLWFTEFYGESIGSITPQGQITEYRLPHGGGPYGITVGPDGNLWFTEYAVHKIGSITPQGHIPSVSHPLHLAQVYQRACQQSLRNHCRPRWQHLVYHHWQCWLYRENDAARPIHHLRQICKRQALIHKASRQDRMAILWFTEQAGAIGRMTPKGVLTDYPLGGD